MGGELIALLAERFELSRGHAHNVRPMEGLRGFAVLLVFLVHFASLSAPFIDGASTTAAVLAGLHAMGNVGVDLFFLLSGYLIYGSLIKRTQPFLPYFKRRVMRIYPTFLVVFAVYVALCFAVPGVSKLPPGSGERVRYLLANLALLPGIFAIEPLITVAWSLSYEMFYYLVVPVLMLLGVRRLAVRERVLLFLVLAGLIFACALLFGTGRVRLVMFIAGILLCEAMRSPMPRLPPDWLALGAVAGVLGVTLLPMAGVLRLVQVSAIFAGFFVLCLACFGRPEGWLARGFSWTPLRWLGNMSYSFYLLHGLVLKAAFMLLAARFPSTEHALLFCLVAFPLMLALALAASALLFLAIERPFSLAGDTGKLALRTAA